VARPSPATALLAKIVLYEDGVVISSGVSYFLYHKKKEGRNHVENFFCFHG